MLCPKCKVAVHEGTGKCVSCGTFFPKEKRTKHSRDSDPHQSKSGRNHVSENPFPAAVPLLFASGGISAILLALLSFLVWCLDYLAWVFCYEILEEMQWEVVPVMGKLVYWSILLFISGCSFLVMVGASAFQACGIRWLGEFLSKRMRVPTPRPAKISQVVNGTLGFMVFGFLFYLGFLRGYLEKNMNMAMLFPLFICLYGIFYGYYLLGSGTEKIENQSSHGFTGG